jgi:aryl-alcohol dehydrogenase-like predicted oxidoreductase
MPVLGLGAATLGREINEKDSLHILDTAFALGFRHFDTAEAYGGGNARAYRKNVLGVEDVRETTGTMHSSEILLGQWVRERHLRDEVQIATKVSSGFRSADVTAALERSLERMGLDSVDLYYLHTIPKDVPLEEPLHAMKAARHGGRIHALGVCNASAEQLKQAQQAATSIEYCQNAYNLAQAAQSRESLDYCTGQGIRFVGYSPLAAGFLTGKYGARGELVPKGTRFDVIPGHQDVYFKDEGFTALERLEAASAKSGVPKHLLAMAWVLRHAEIAIVLVGATRLEHLRNALQAQELAADSALWERVGL